jgi:hypothetical protein
MDINEHNIYKIEKEKVATSAIPDEEVVDKVVVEAEGGH